VSPANTQGMAVGLGGISRTNPALQRGRRRVPNTANCSRGIRVWRGAAGQKRHSMVSAGRRACVPDITNRREIVFVHDAHQGLRGGHGRGIPNTICRVTSPAGLLNHGLPLCRAPDPTRGGGMHRDRGPLGGIPCPACADETKRRSVGVRIPGEKGPFGRRSFVGE